jgi:hypothetical protein
MFLRSALRGPGVDGGGGGMEVFMTCAPGTFASVCACSQGLFLVCPESQLLGWHKAIYIRSIFPMDSYEVLRDYLAEQ